MNLTQYKILITALAEASKDINYLVALYTFAINYPDKSKMSKI